MPQPDPSITISPSDSIGVGTPIRVVIADDSSFVRKALTLLLEEDPDIEVVGIASDGKMCLDLVESLSPDLLTLDLNMPLIDGLSVLRVLNHEFPLPVILVSSLAFEGAGATLEALELGAVDFIAKQITPQSLDIDLFRTDLIRKVKWAARNFKPRDLSPGAQGKRRILKRTRQPRPQVGVVAIGASTGGPVALQNVIPMLPPDFPVPVVVAQHIPAEFSPSLASRLDSKSSLTVREAQDGEQLEKGLVLIAPGGQHLEIRHRARVKLLPNEKGNLRCPSVDRLFSSMAAIFSSGTLGVVLTGLGDDGLEGSQVVQRKGGQILVQNEATAMAYSMPGSVVERGLADREAPLNLIAPEILRIL
jgi:two-component system chemotaxis response regulator CheB